MTDELYELGLEKRRKVLGAEFVDRTIEGADDFTRGFQHFLTEYCWEESGPRERPSATVSTASTPSASWPPSAESRSSSSTSEEPSATAAPWTSFEKPSSR